MHIAFILGRTPRLAYAELERAARILPFQWSLSMINPGVALLKAENAELHSGIDFSGSSSKYYDEIAALQRRLGGTVRIVEIVGKSNDNDVNQALVDALGRLPEGRITLGISAFGRRSNAGKIALSVKKASGRSLRVVLPTEGNELTTAQIAGNKLVGGKDAMEIVLTWNGTEWLVGRTITVQDIADYRVRDFQIPMPDPVSGMLPPKLAQTMVNLAVGGEDAAVYDPFCGNGRIVEEAALMRYEAAGSDISEERVASARENLAWIAKRYALTLHDEPEAIITKVDARLATVPSFEKPYYIVTEPYLGKPLRSFLQSHEEEKWAKELVGLYGDFFEAWARVPESKRPQGFLMVFPAAKRRSSRDPLSIRALLVDRLSQLGYSLSQVSEYGRPDAFVIREIVRLSYSSTQGSTK